MSTPVRTRPWRRLIVEKQFQEMQDLEALANDFSDLLQVEVMEQISFEDVTYPIYALSIGKASPDKPALGFFGGVHGLERIGSEVVLSYLRMLLELARWDQVTQERLQDVTLVFMPIVNPVGIALRSRSNGNGVDLMRNSPLNCVDQRLPLVSGHTLSSRLPWYRGDYSGQMEKEAEALCRVVRKYLWPASFSMALDVHSGFGLRDRLWFPYAHSRKPFPYLAEAFSFQQLLNKTHPHHVYEIEPVSRQYTIQGDLWDYLFLQNEEWENKSVFIPWTLEMGSWNWLKKNPMQIFNPFGVFHPIKPHRRSRTLRRHVALFDFFLKIISSRHVWFELSQDKRQQHESQARAMWYEGIM